MEVICISPIGPIQISPGPPGGILRPLGGQPHRATRLLGVYGWGGEPFQTHESISTDTLLAERKPAHIDYPAKQPYKEILFN